jgi:hypothetical protein
VADVLGQFEQEFVIEELKAINADIEEVMQIFRDVQKIEQPDIPKLLEAQIRQLHIFRALKNIEGLLLKG